MNNPEFRHYQHWADRRMENLVQRMQVRLKSIKPSVALVTWTTNAGRFGHFLSIPRNMPSRMNLLLDAPDQEFWADETNRGATIVPAFSNAYIWATTNHRVAFSEPYILSHGNPYGKDSFPAKEIEYRMLLAATHGALPSIAVSQPPNLQESLYHCMDQLQERKAWLINKRPEKWAAMVMSDNSRNFYGRSSGLVEERYMSHVFGTFRAALLGPARTLATRGSAAPSDKYRGRNAHRGSPNRSSRNRRDRIIKAMNRRYSHRGRDVIIAVKVCALRNRR